MDCSKSNTILFSFIFLFSSYRSHSFSSEDNLPFQDIWDLLFYADKQDDYFYYFLYEK